MLFRKKAPERPVTRIGTGVHLDDPTRIVEIALPDEDRRRHCFIFGTTGVGKTRLVELMIAQDIAKGYSVVYFDPKGDQQSFTRIYEEARRAGREGDMMLVTPIFPEYSAVVDPLAYYFMPDELVGHIVSGITVGKEPYYRNVAKEITTAVVLSNILLAREEGRLPSQNLDAIRQGIRRSALEQTMHALRRLADPEAASVAGALQDILDSPQDYYAKVSSTLRTCLNDLSFGNVGAIIGKADSNRFMQRLEEGRSVILIVHTGSSITREAGATLSRVILSMLQSFIGRVYMSNRQRVSPPLAVYLDEAQNILFQGAENLFAQAGAADVMMHAFAQSINQLEAVLGREFARSILDIANTKLFMRCNDAETSEYVVRHFGVHNVLAGIFSTAQVTTREIEQDVLKTQDILGLQPREFYLMTFSGRYRGATIDAPPPELRIVFPDAPAAQRGQGREVDHG
ncbi:type IV secretory system conjugative DNA transfer family protein [Geoalkalibacter halelectricus]|uniref:type IV secretory system conjugative DNA transfer family protein n=1 Tax=Geoalkalibacter halelectricus TaxID=2847045 RepID=UPI003D2099C0